MGKLSYKIIRQNYPDSGILKSMLVYYRFKC